MYDIYFFKTLNCLFNKYKIKKIIFWQKLFTNLLITSLLTRFVSVLQQILYK